jgi:C2H2 transcription facotor
MMMDSRAAAPPNQSSGMDYRRESTTQLQRGLNRLELNTPPRDSAGAWANDVHQAVLARGEQAVRFDPDVKPAHVPTSVPPSSGPPMHGSRHQYTMSAPMISTPRDIRRHGWYHGPVTVHPHGETIHDGRAHVDRLIHPNVNSFQGFPAREPQPSLHSQSSHGVDRMERIMERPHPTNNARLDALVAVATNEGKAY